LDVWKHAGDVTHATKGSRPVTKIRVHRFGEGLSVLRNHQDQTIDSVASDLQRWRTIGEERCTLRRE
jgi:hypothetical protein